MVGDRFEFAADDGERLVGTLTATGSPGLAPAALLVNGSGPLERDSNMLEQALDVASSLAAALAARGVTSLRFDKRGVGESGGEYLRTGFDRETGDAASALLALRQASGVDGARITVVGHSVGATIAIRLSARYRWIAGAVLLAAASSTGEEVMRTQSERIAASMRGLQRLAARRFLRGQEDIRRQLLASEGDVVELEGGLPARWFREYMAYDPALDLPAVTCPVLAITGRSDLQVDPADVERIGALVGGPFTGSTPDDLTHVLRLHPGRPSLSTYPAQLREPVNRDVLDTVAEWVAAR
jgi:pimeloyl-ACP methyl ester carboxylesterase